MIGLQHVVIVSLSVLLFIICQDLNLPRLQFLAISRKPHQYGHTRLAVNKYCYEPLPAQHVRLLTLLPGSFEDDIHVRLHPVETGSHESPRYHALSYVWGSTDTNDHVLVDSGESQHSLPITRNLYVALQHLRHSSASRTMWVDAVCINQNDIEERNDQVSRMAHIYKLAEKVILWLGPAEDGS